MSRTIRLLIILLHLVISHGLNAQNGICGLERFGSFELCILKDNLPEQLTPNVIDSIYYSKLKLNRLNYKAFQTIDVIHHKRELHLRSKRANDGYLFVNKCIVDKISTSYPELGNMIVSYVYNDTVTTTKKDVRRILRLREGRIRVQNIIVDKQKGVITVFIVDL